MRLTLTVTLEGSALELPRHIVCASLLATACSGGSAPAEVCPEGPLVVLSDESMASEVGVLPLDGSPPALLPSSVLGWDPALSVSAGRRFVIARQPYGTIFEVDRCGRATAQFASGASGEKPDPWDVAVASDGTLWIARYLEPSALVLGPDGHVVAKVDLAQYEVNGVTPNASGVRVIATPNGEKALFLLERLDAAYASVAPTMVVVDTSTLVAETAIDLVGENPQALSTQPEDSGALYIASPGRWNDAAETSAGIERFDTATLRSTLILDEPALGGSPTTVAVSLGCGATIIADPTSVNRTSLVVFALDGSTPPHIVLGPTSGFDLHGVLWTKNRLLVGDGRTRRVHTFSVGPSCTVTPAADLAELPMPPVALAE